MRTEQRQLFHASCVALSKDRSLLIIGPSGAGKSTLALHLMSLGAVLVSDDQTWIEPQLNNSELVATPHENTQGMIEARFVGLLQAKNLPHAKISAVVDLGKVEKDRLPMRKNINLLGVELPCFYAHESPSFALGLWQWLQGGWHEYA